MGKMSISAAYQSKETVNRDSRWQNSSTPPKVNTGLNPLKLPWLIRTGPSPDVPQAQYRIRNTGSTCTAGRIMIAVRCVEQFISQLIWSGSVLDPFVVADFWADPFKMKCSWVTCSRLYKSSGFSYCTFAFDDICNATLKVKCEMGFNSNSQWPVSESLGYQWRLILVQIRDAHTGEH